jgi:hypothetical protein
MLRPCSAPFGSLVGCDLALLCCTQRLGSEEATLIGLATKLPILHPLGDDEDEPALGLKTAVFWLALIAAIIAALSEVGKRKEKRTLKHPF